MESRSRAEYRTVGIDDNSDSIDFNEPPALVADRPRELPPADLEIPLDVEVMDGGPITPDEPERQPADNSAFNPFEAAASRGPTGPSGSGLMPLEDAVAAQGEMRRRTLPRGAS
jgi:hypothetical protein